MEPVIFQLPADQPEDYLRWVAWWRDCGRFMTSAATLGAVPEPRRGSNKALDLIDFEGPRLVEAEARRALDEGETTVAPSIAIDADVAVEARQIIRRRLDWLQKMATHGAPKVDPSLERLIAATRIANDQTFRAAGLDVA
jgi:hypothetical protein